MSLPFEPACQPLLLGSLPYRSAAQALEVSRRYAGAIVAWPQLWQRGFREHSIVHSALGFPGLMIDETRAKLHVDRAVAREQLDRLELAYLENRMTAGQLSEADAVGLAELMRQGDGLRGVLAVAGHSIGPISLAAQLPDEQQQPLIYDSALFEALTHHLRLRVMWQESFLAELNRPTIICLDEPFLEMIGLPFLPIDWDEARTHIEEVLGGIIGCKGIFASGATDWGQVLRTSVELIVADVYTHPAALLGAAESLAEFLERDGIIGLAIVPTDADALLQTDVPALARRLDAMMVDLAQAGIDAETLARRALIVPNGPLGSLSAEHAELALQLTAKLSEQLRAQYGFAGERAQKA